MSYGTVVPGIIFLSGGGGSGTIIKVQASPTTPTVVVTGGTGPTVTIQTNAGTTGLSPVYRGPVTLAAPYILPAYTYTHGTGTTTLVGAFIQANTNGALGNIDGVASAVNQLVAVLDITGTGPHHANGIYKITNVGSVSTKWKMTRVAPFNTVTTWKRPFSLFIARGTQFGGGLVSYGSPTVTSPTLFPLFFGVAGRQSVVMTEGAVARADSIAMGGGTVASGANTLAVGDQCYAEAGTSAALLTAAEAYRTTQLALGGGGSTVSGSRRIGGAQVTEYVASLTIPAATSSTGKKATIVLIQSAKIIETAPKIKTRVLTYQKTLAVTLVVVARGRTSPYRSVKWTASGVLIGNKVTTYAWISTPTPTKGTASATTTNWTLTLTAFTGPTAVLKCRLHVTGGGVALNAIVYCKLYEIAT